MTSLFRRSSSNGSSRGGSSAQELNNSRPARQVRRLEFNQAMEDFKTMFPNMDYDIIECVLRANNGAVDATIDQLLQMNLDSSGCDDSSDSEDSIPPEVLLTGGSQHVAVGGGSLPALLTSMAGSSQGGSSVSSCLISAWVRCYLAPAGRQRFECLIRLIWSLWPAWFVLDMLEAQAKAFSSLPPTPKPNRDPFAAVRGPPRAAAPRDRLTCPPKMWCLESSTSKSPPVQGNQCQEVAPILSAAVFSPSCLGGAFLQPTLTPSPRPADLGAYPGARQLR